MNWRYLLLYRWAAFNLFALAVLLVLHLHGLVVPVYLGDPSYLVYVITGLFAYGLVLCGYRIWKTSIELNQVKAAGRSGLRAFRELSKHTDKASIKEAFEIKLVARIAVVKYISSSLVMLGLLGTVIGFIMVLTNIPSMVVGDAAQVPKLVQALTNGLGVALYNTLVGSVTNLWLNANYSMLRTGVANLFAAILESPDTE